MHLLQSWKTPLQVLHAMKIRHLKDFWKLKINFVNFFIAFAWDTIIKILFRHSDYIKYEDAIITLKSI
jgi:hypothetical protein